VIANNTCCDNSSYTLDFIKSIQGEISKRLASKANTENFSRKNDIAFKTCINFEEMVWMHQILEEIIYCNPCFTEDMEFDIESVVNIAKNYLNE
jgi:hypothetical protein